jgi:chemotaxis protein MotA
MSSDPSLSPYAKGPVAGAIFGLTIVLSPIIFSAHASLMFFSLAGLIIVAGGVIATAYMSFQTADVHQALRAIPVMLKQPRATHTDLNRDMNTLLHWASLIKTGGLGELRLSLNEQSTKIPFVNYGLNMVMSEYRPDEVRAMMETAADASFDRDCVPVDVLRAMTSHAPAFGMIGTLVGMIALLCDLNDTIASTGSTLAVAFLSTLYGVVSARMIYMPAAARLQQEADNRQRRHTLITEGMVMLARGETPSHVRDRLNGFLRPEQHDYFDAIGGPAETGLIAMHAAAKLSSLPRARHRRSGLVGAIGT